MQTQNNRTAPLVLALAALALNSSLMPEAQAASWLPTGPLITARRYHTATLLPNAKVLVAGGDDWSASLYSAELYDPGSGTWTATGSLGKRTAHTATLLNNGKVLVAGGLSDPLKNQSTTNSAELYDPASGAWTATGSLNNRRGYHTATLLPGGKVLVAGGYDQFGNLQSAELYDPASGVWTVTGYAAIGRASHTATLLTNGKVLVAGGDESTTAPTEELYDPVSGIWTTTGALNTPRYFHTATLLPDGRVLVAGGLDKNYHYLSSAELYNPSSGTWTTTTSLNIARNSHTATLLATGKVLVAAGAVVAASTPTAELYDPSDGTWTATASLNTARDCHTATLLSNGRVLAAGGGSNGGLLSSAELYDTGAPVNDACGGAIALTENIYYAQNTVSATDDGASTCLGRARSKGVWFTFTPAQTGTATVDTCPSDFDTMIEVFSGTCSELTSIGCNDDGDCRPGSSFSFPCRGGTTYRIWAGGFNGASGNLQVRATVVPANDACSGAIALSENVYYAENTANATDDGISTCLGRMMTKGVWFTYTPALTGKATVDTCPSDFDTDIEVFTGTCGALTPVGCNDYSSSCIGIHYRSSFSFPCREGTTYLIWAGGDYGASGNLQIRAYAAIAPANDDCSGAIALAENVYYAQNTANATDDGWSVCLGRTMSKGVWFTYTPMHTGTAAVETCPSDFDTNLELFTGGCGALTSIGCNEDSLACGGYWPASLNFPCTAGTTYLIYAGGYNGASGNLQIRVRVPALYWHREAGGVLDLSWATGYVLQSGTVVTGPWSNVAGVLDTNGPMSSYSTPMTNTARFFRVR